MSSEEMQAAIKKLEERIDSLKHTTDEKFLELDRENNVGVIMVSGRGCPPRKRSEKLFFIVQKLIHNVFGYQVHPAELTTLGHYNSNLKSPIICR